MNVGDRAVRKDTREEGVITALKPHLSACEFTGDASGPMGWFDSGLLEAAPVVVKKRRVRKKAE